jgi:hypothetical protein
MMDWYSSMQQTYKYYVVDPGTWKNDHLMENVESCTINWDLSDSTLGYASFDCESAVDECYIRPYLVVFQNGVKGEFPLGTFLTQTPSFSFDGRKHKVSIDAYTPLIELKASPPPVGYAILENANVMESVTKLCRENMRAPVVPAEDQETLRSDFVANLDDTWLSFLTDLMMNAEYSFGLDELGRVLFAPVQDTASLQPVWTYDDGNSSILYPNIEDERDLYGIPNVVEVIYSSGAGYMYSRVVNRDADSPVSTVSRGREVIYRESSPSLIGQPTQEMLDAYAVQLLRNLSCLEHMVTYTHGYCPVRIGDCVMLDYKRSGIHHVKAKVTAQSIKCETGCPVEETAVYTTRLWR